MKAAARIFVCLLAYLFISLFITSPVSAQQSINTDPYIDLNTNPDVPRNLHTLTQSIVLELGSTLTCALVGVDPINTNGKCLGFDPQTKKIGYVQNGQSGGLIGFMGSMIALTYTPPAHVADYTRYLTQNFGITKTAYAAPTKGTGFDGISPLTNLWVTFRNITYLFFVIVFTIIGIAIMLRIKIDPRTVMSIENQIPKLIIGIILVTLSFPIAGFMIDLMWVLTYLVIAVLNPIILAANPSSTPINIFSNPSGVLESMTVQVAGTNQSGFWGIVFNGAGMIKDIIAGPPPTGNNIVEAMIKAINTIIQMLAFPFSIGCALKDLPLGIGNVFNPVLPAEVCKIIANPVGAFFGFIGGLIAFLVIAGMLLFALFKLWISLIKAYIGILLDIVFAPFWIIAGALPGSPLGFGAWLKSLLANLLPFPATIAMFMIGNIFIQAFSAKSSNVFIPPLLGFTPDPGAISTIIGIGIILITSQITTIIKDAFKSPSLKYTSAIGQSFGGFTGSAKGFGGTFAAGYLKTPEVGKKGGFGAVARRILGA